MARPAILLDPHPRRAGSIFDPEQMRRLHALAEVITEDSDGRLASALVEAALPRISAILGQTDLPAERIARAPHLRAVINVEGNFLPNVDAAACAAQGIEILSVAPVFAVPVAEMALGLALFVSGGYSIAGLPSLFGDALAYAAPWGIPVSILYTAGIVIVTYVLLNRTFVGRYFYAVGSNQSAARLSGIPTGRYLVVAYAVAGLIVGIAGVLMTARTESGEANLGGADLVLKAVAGCIIGGVALAGGKGLLRNVVLGALFITALSNGMNLLKINSYLQTFIMGAVLIAAIALDQFRLRLSGAR